VCIYIYIYIYIWEEGAEEKFESVWKEETEWWRKLYNEKLHNIYSSPVINRLMKSKRI
jgi:hypothetical protein